uniref:TIMELESS-interacting protein n=1 Tax=Setaria digitata TaxID=48799 RepID=A0A915PZX8_9BILA
MDNEDDFEAAFVENESEQADKDAAPSDEQILNDLLKKDKKKIHRPRLVQHAKFRDIELCGPNGFLELKRMFDGYAPTNKNPYDDLLIMMNRIEHWGHRLCPKMRFENFVARVESLGDKRLVKTMLTKMRLDMPLTDEDFLSNKENRQTAQLSDNGENDTDALGDDSDLFEIFGNLRGLPQASSSSELSVRPKLSEEQIKRIEQNKLRAQKLRAEREKRMNQANDLDTVTMKADGPSCEQAASNISVTSKSLVTENESSGKLEELGDSMMDDNEALDFIFSST